MGEDLAMLEIGAGEADDVAIARTAIEPVLAVEDHVLRPLHLIEADRLDAEEPVVLRERRAAAALDRRWRRQLDEAGIDIDLLDRLAAVLRPFDVDADRGQEDQADHRRGDVAL